VVAGTSARRRGLRGRLGANDQIRLDSDSPSSRSRSGAGVGGRRLDLGPVADDARIAEQAVRVATPDPATASISNPANALRNASRLRRVVNHESPDWNASKQSFSNKPRSSTTGRPHSRS
jgi:hypothetical protein